MLSFRNENKSFLFLNAPLVLFILISITVLRIYSLYVSPIELSVDEAQYWHWSRNIDFGYFTKPPMIAWLIAFSTAIFGNEEWAVRLFSPLLHLWISIVLWGISHIAFGIKAGRVAALIWIFTPAASLGSFIISTDTPLLLFWSLSTFFIFKLFINETILNSFLAGILIGLAFLSKYAALYFVIFLVLWWLTYDRGKKISINNLLIIFIASISIASGNIYWNYLNDFATVSHTVSNADLSEIIFNFSNMTNFLLSQLLVYGPILFLLYLFISFDSFFKKDHLPFLGFLSFPIIILITMQSFLKIANPNWAVTAYIAATIMISAYVTKNNNIFLRLFFKIGLVINLTLSIFILKVTLTGNFYPLNLKSDPLRKNLGFELISKTIENNSKTHKVSKIIFETRGDVSRFNYYLNRENNRFKNKILLKSNNLKPGNFYEANHSYNNTKFTSGEKILIVSDKMEISDYPRLFDIIQINKVSVKTIKDIYRTYYLFTSTFK
jgi:4-amino-4-deoxy-L-arabinose transferase-like glycosyltransferase